MLCIHCGQEIETGQRVCPECGYSCEVSLRAVNLSSRLYNEALSLIGEKRLSEAEVLLCRSVKADKRNIYARNLLGLICMRTGRIGEASKHWIISANIDRITGNEVRENPAVGYLKDISENTKEYEKLDDAVKLYNNALSQIDKANIDVAVMKLKRAVGINPNFVRAWELLALCYIREKNNKKASQACLEALKTDSTSKNAVRYLLYTGSMTQKLPDKSEIAGGFYRVVMFCAGVVACMLVMVSVILPSVEKRKDDEYNALSENYMQLQEKYNQYKQTADNTITELNTQKDELNTQVEQTKGSQQIIKAKELFDKASYCETADILMETEPSTLDAQSLSIYNEIYSETMEKASWQKYTDGKNAFSREEYERAKELLNECIKYSEDIPNTKYTAIYQLGKVVFEQGDKEKAKEYFTQVVNNHPDETMQGYAREYLEEE